MIILGTHDVKITKKSHCLSANISFTHNPVTDMEEEVAKVNSVAFKLTVTNTPTNSTGAAGSHINRTMMERTVNALLALFAAALICGVITVEGRLHGQ